MTLRDIGNWLSAVGQSAWDDIQIAFTEPLWDWPVWVLLLAAFVAWNLVGAARNIWRDFTKGFGEIKGDYVVVLILGTIGFLAFMGLALELLDEPGALGNPGPLLTVAYFLAGVASFALVVWSIRKMVKK